MNDKDAVERVSEASFVILGVAFILGGLVFCLRIIWLLVKLVF